VSWCPHWRAHLALWPTVDPSFGMRAVVPARRTSAFRAFGGASRDRPFPVRHHRIPEADGDRKLRPFSSSKPELRVSVLAARLPAGPFAARANLRPTGPTPHVTAPKSRRNPGEFHSAVWIIGCSSETLTGTSWSKALVASATTAISPTVGAPPSWPIAAVYWRPRAGAACPCRRLPRALPAAHRPFTRPLSVLRRPHDRNRRHPPCEHFRRCGSLEHLMIPMRDPNTAQRPEPAPAVDTATPPSLPATGDRRYPGKQPSKPRRSPNPLISLPPMAAASIPIAAHCSVDSNRYRHSTPTTGRAQSP
jgi:hypothetical protein